MRPFTGFNLREMRRYLQLAYIYEEFRQLEKPASKQIRAFLRAVGEEALVRFGADQPQTCWKVKVRSVRMGAINWAVDLVPEPDVDVTFNVWLYYFPHRHYNQVFHAAVGLALRSPDAVSSLSAPVRAHFCRLKEQADLAGAGTVWEYALSSNHYEEYLESVPGLAWERLEKWQETRDYLVERVGGWRAEFWPIVERHYLSPTKDSPSNTF